MLNIEHSLERQIERLSLRIARLNGISKRCANIRLCIVLAGVPLIWTCFRLADGWVGFMVLMIVLTAFCIVLQHHGRLRKSIRQSRILQNLKSAHVARIRLDWERIPSVPAIQAPVEHPFGIDLDISGEHSLHRLIDMSFSLEGSRRLLNWLLEGKPEPDVSIKRQMMVKELSELTLLRERLFVNAMTASGVPGGRLDTESILKWLETQRSPTLLARALLPLSILAVSNLLIVGLAAIGMIPKYFCITFVFYITILLLFQIEMAKIFRDSVTMETTLDRVQAVFRRLENYRYSRAPHLASLCAPFLDPKSRPSTKLKHISGVVSAISVRSNPVIWLFLNGILPWDAYFARRLEQYREDLSASLPKWMGVLADVEALSSLANFAYLNRDYCYPELVCSHEAGAYDGHDREIAAMAFIAKNMGHPMVSHGKRVYNSLCLNKEDKIALITGSNMAGKSTFLRTIGVNLCLAYAGAPACAGSLRAGFFRIFACMRINDSVTDGFSFFYAEVKRLKMLLSATQVSSNELPVIFLLDEIFRGTNNRERFVGSRAFIRALAEQAALGAIASHDLELVKLADENRAITNFHFREEVKDNMMIFDYKLHPGPCPTTNALKIMAMAGLPV
ncbi:MAG: MutS family DNA mismatch repair protein [Syntrophobacteraceae bacterium]